MPVTPSASRASRWGVYASLSALTLAVLFYLRDAQQIHDSMSYAVSIKTGWRLYHPHHLLFGPIVRALWLPIAFVADTVGATGTIGAIGAIEAAQLHNAVWASVAVTSGCALLYRRGGSLFLGAAAGVLLIATYGFLFFGVQVEVYVAAAASFTLAILVLSREHTLPRLAAAACLLALSIFYHQPNVLLCLPLAAFFLIRSRGAGVRRAIGVIGIAGALVLCTYIAVYIAEGGSASVSEFIEFTLRYAVGEDQHAREWGASDNLGTEGLTAMLAAQQSTWIVLPDAMSGTASRALGVVSALLAAWSLVAILRGRDADGVRVLLLGWWVVNDLFYLWWQPGQREFFVAPLVPMVLLLLFAVGDLLPRPGQRRVSGALLTALGLALMVFNVRHIEARMGQTMRPAAAAYLELVPEDAFHLSFRNVVQELRYSFDVPLDRSANLTLAKRRLLSGIGTDALAPLPREGQIVLPGAEALPSRKGSAERAPGWMRYLTWLFRLDLDSTGIEGPVRGPSVECVAAAQGPFYLVQGPADVVYPDLLRFFRALDGALADGGRRPAFERWFMAHQDALLAAQDG